MKKLNQTNKKITEQSKKIKNKYNASLSAWNYKLTGFEPAASGVPSGVSSRQVSDERREGSCPLSGLHPFCFVSGYWQLISGKSIEPGHERATLIKKNEKKRGRGIEIVGSSAVEFNGICERLKIIAEVRLRPAHWHFEWFVSLFVLARSGSHWFRSTRSNVCLSST